MRNIYMNSSILLLGLHALLRLRNGLLLNTNYHDYYFAFQYTKLKKMRNEAAYMFQFFILVTYCGLPGVFFRPLFFFSQLSFMLTIVWPVWVLAKPFIDRVTNFYNAEGYKQSFGYHLREEPKPAEHLGAILLILSSLLVSIHWSLAPKKSVKSCLSDV